MTDNTMFGPRISSADYLKIRDEHLNGHQFAVELFGKDGRKTPESDNRMAEIQKQFADAGVSDLWGTKKEVKALPEILGESEIVKYATSGLVAGTTVLMVCTDSRILFIDKGMLYGIKSTEIPLNMVNAVSYSTGLMFGTISITNGATITKVENVNKGTAQMMVDAINANRSALNRPQAQSSPAPQSALPSAADQIREFKGLLDDGIITQSEFDAKKKELLGL
ncbi:PH domain-containing protein [Lacticaseibacillus nasuensis]|nr:PH domain-containing protein [Lacticaseibacillus nasuensis]